MKNPSGRRNFTSVAKFKQYSNIILECGRNLTA